jgi:hypothetical protein
MTTEDAYEWHNSPDAERRGVTAREDGFGSFEASRIFLHPAGSGMIIRVKRADPRILISDLMMDLIRKGLAGWKADGDLLRCTAVNGTWVYRVGEYLEDRRAWVAEWPD